MEFKIENIDEVIIKRKSIRKYKPTPLSEEVLGLIQKNIDAINPIFGFRYRVRICHHDEFMKLTGGRWRINGPHYIMLYSDNKEVDLYNIGYVGEKIVLKLTEMGIGTCWLGGATSIEKVDGFPFTIAIVFGEPDEPFGTLERKRKSLETITSSPFKDQVNAQLAPSAMNFQPWYFKVKAKQIDIYRVPNLLIPGIKKVQSIDLGIVAAHIQFSYVKKDIYKRRYAFSLYL